MKITEQVNVEFVKDSRFGDVFNLRITQKPGNLVCSTGFASIDPYYDEGLTEIADHLYVPELQLVLSKGTAEKLANFFNQKRGKHGSRKSSSTRNNRK